MRCEDSCEGTQPTVFSDHQHLSKVSIEIQYLSPLIGSDSDRQHDCQHF